MKATLPPPFPCEFEGTKVDIDVLDFIGYEAGDHPNGLEGASILLGNVLVQTGALEWAAADDGSLLLVSTHDTYPRYVIWPYARVLEIENSSNPQFGKYGWVLQKTLIDLLAQDLDPDIEDNVVALFDPDDDFWRYWPAVMKSLSTSSNKAT